MISGFPLLLTSGTSLDPALPVPPAFDARASNRALTSSRTCCTASMENSVFVLSWASRVLTVLVKWVTCAANAADSFLWRSIVVIISFRSAPSRCSDSSLARPNILAIFSIIICDDAAESARRATSRSAFEGVAGGALTGELLPRQLLPRQADFCNPSGFPPARV